MRERHVQRLCRALCLWRSDSKWFCVTKCTVHMLQAHMLQAHMLRAIVTEWFVWVEAFALQSLIGTELKPGDWTLRLLQRGEGLPRFGRPISKAFYISHFTFSVLFFHTPKNIALKDSQVWQYTQQRICKFTKLFLTSISAFWFWAHKVDPVGFISPSLQRRKLRSWNTDCLDQSHTVNEWPNQDLKLDLWSPNH